MRILIVNGYSLKYQNKFKFFEQSIVKFIHEQKELVDTENEYFIRDKNNLDDYLYEPITSHTKTQNGNNFDQMDLIFVTGDANLRPWLTSAHKIITLLRMCIKVQKRVFACSFAFQALVFLSATNLDVNINILNATWGGQLKDLKQAKFIEELKHNSYFLENTTGDLYYYNYEQSEWIPKSNVGMHQRNAAQKFQSVGRFIIKLPIYKAKDGLDVDIIFRTEVMCQIKNTHLSDPYFDRIPNQFVVPIINNWDVHPFAFTNSNKIFLSLGESEYGPTMIQYPSILAVQFEVNKKYLFTSTILQNFILCMMKEFRDSKNFGLSNSILVKEQSTTTTFQYLQNFDENKLQNSSLLKKTKKVIFKSVEDESIYTRDVISRHYRHSGYSINKNHVSNIVNFNFVEEKRIKMGQMNSQSPDNQSIKQFQSQLSVTSAYKQSMHQSQKLSGDQTLKCQNNDKLLVDSPKPQKLQISQFPLTQILQTKKSQGIIKELSSGQVRQFLHPSIKQECLDYKNLWIPGCQSGNRVQNPHQTLQTSLHPFSFSQTYRVPGQSPMLSPKTVQNLQIKYQYEFLSSGTRYKTQDDDSEKVIVRNVKQESLSGQTIYCTKKRTLYLIYVCIFGNFNLSYINFLENRQIKVVIIKRVLSMKLIYFVLYNMLKLPKHNHHLVLRSDIVEASKNSSKYNKEAISLFRCCPKFNDNPNRTDRQLKQDQAIIYLKLRSQVSIQHYIEQCTRHDAVIFSQRHLCKWDSTTTKDGPASCRILNPKPIKQAMVSGWQNAGQTLQYDMGTEHETDAQMFCLEDSQDRIIQSEFEKNELNIKNDFKTKIKNLQSFYSEMNGKYNFDLKTLGYKGLKEQLHQFNQKYRDSREKPLQYMKYQGIRFLHILDEFTKEENQESGTRTQIVPIKQTAIEELGAFNKLINIKKEKLKIKEKFADDLFFHLKTHHQGDSDGDYDEDDQVLGYRFNSIGDQGGALMTMADSKGLQDIRRKQEDPYIQLQSGLRASDKDLYATEFNQSQYVFKVKDIHSQKEQLRMQKVQKIMERMGDMSPSSSPKRRDVQLGDFGMTRSVHQKSTQQNSFSKKIKPHSLNHLAQTSTTHHSHQPSSFNPNQNSFHRFEVKTIENRQLNSSRGQSNSAHDSYSKDKGRKNVLTDRETDFQYKMRRFIRKNIEKINTPQQLRNDVSPSNLQELIQQRDLLKTRESSKIQQLPQQNLKFKKIRGKLTLDLMKGKNIFTELSSQPQTTRVYTTDQIRKQLLRFKNNQPIQAKEIEKLSMQQK